MLILFAMLVAVIVTIAANGWMMTRTLGGIMFFLYFLFVLQDLLLLHLLLSYLLTYLLTYLLPLCAAGPAAQLPRLQRRRRRHMLA